ncbi:hypothetical protein FRB99_006153 [Tulasnella sp. 403]|nr:hypothetical protein FRB99_006153 [Tulasnella sp. 403]
MDHYAPPVPSPRPQDTSFIGKPITYTRGPNAGKTIRAALEEYQKPDLGRKFAKRDRRPLDPPPVVRVRLWEVFDVGLPTQSELELAADDVEVQGLVAHVDLFRVNQDNSIATDNASETANLTKHTFGSSFVHATHILDLTGQPVIIFVFADLSVRLEGVFALRYRIFDLVSRVEGTDAIPVAAELYGGVFTVYSTKEFPGLQASTPLTKHLSRWGVRVNLREGERKRKPTGAAGHEDDDDDEDEDGDDDDGGEGGGAGPSKKAGGSGKGGKHNRPGKGKGATKPGPDTVALTTTTAVPQTTATYSQYQDSQQSPFTSTPGTGTGSVIQQSHPTGTTSPASPSRTNPKASSEGGEEDQTRDTGLPNEQSPWGGPPVNWSRPPITGTGNGWSRPPTVPTQSSSIGDWSRRPEKHYVETRSPKRNPQEVASTPSEPPRKRHRVTPANTSYDTNAALAPRSDDLMGSEMTLSSRMIPNSGAPPLVSQSPTFMPPPPPSSSNYQQAMPPTSYTSPSSSSLVPPHRSSFQSNTAFALPPPAPVPVSTHSSLHSANHMHPAAATYAVSSNSSTFGYRSR